MRGQTVLRVHIWSEIPITRVWARIDEHAPFTLREQDRFEWSAVFEASSLTKGTHRLFVSAKDASGIVGEASIEFPVDAAGRYTALPRVQPIVTATHFC